MQPAKQYLSELSSVAQRHFRGSVLRGAVFFIGMSSWGSQRVKSLKVPFSVILPAIAAVLEYVEEEIWLHNPYSLTHPPTLPPTHPCA